MIYKYVRPFYGLLLYSVDCVFYNWGMIVCVCVCVCVWERERHVHLSIFSFVACAFGVTSKKSLPNIMSWSVCPLFSSKSLMVLSLTFRSLVTFWLTFLYMVWGKGPASFSGMQISSFPSTMLKRLSFPHWMVLEILIKNHLTKGAWVAQSV